MHGRLRILLTLFFQSTHTNASLFFTSLLFLHSWRHVYPLQLLPHFHQPFPYSCTSNPKATPALCCVFYTLIELLLIVHFGPFRKFLANIKQVSWCPPIMPLKSIWKVKRDLRSSVVNIGPLDDTSFPAMVGKLGITILESQRDTIPIPKQLW